MTEQTDYNSIPLSELEDGGWHTYKPDGHRKSHKNQRKKEQQPNGEAPNGESKEDQGKNLRRTWAETRGESLRKKTPESIQKLLHQRSELRQDNDRLKTELEEAKELIKETSFMRSWTLSLRTQMVRWMKRKRKEAIQDASFNSKIIERELKQL